MFDMKCTINGDPLGNGLIKFKDKKINMFKKVLKASADSIKREVASETKGKLKSNFAIRQENSGLTQIIYNKKFYLHFVNNDVKAHEIKPKKCKFLRWGSYAGKFEFQTLKGKNAGKWTKKKVYKTSSGQFTLNRKESGSTIYAKKVEHPSVKGGHFMEHSLESNRGVILQALKSALDQE